MQLLALPARSIIHAARHIEARLVALKLADALLHLLVGVDAEALVLGDAGQLHVLGVELLLHNLLEGAEGEGLGLLESQTPAMLVSGFARDREKLATTYLWYSLTSSACAPSEPEPMALAS